jgi:PBP1b-binding outer membrane lipoprotein LpoB
MKKALLMILLAAVFLVGCTTSIQDIKDNPDKYMGETVTVKGTSSASIKIGQLSGFTLTDKEGSKIPVSSTDLPNDGDKVSVRGVVMKDTLFGVYLLAKD